jgi:hypothetical protein
LVKVSAVRAARLFQFHGFIILIWEIAPPLAAPMPSACRFPVFPFRQAFPDPFAGEKFSYYL